MESHILCTICDENLHNSIDNVTTVRKLGLTTFIRISRDKGDEKWKLWNGKTEFDFHEKCRKNYGRHPDQPPAKKKRKDTISAELSPIVIEDNNNHFNFTDLCFICGNSLDRMHKVASTVQQKHFTDKIIDIAQRRDDDYGQSVLQRLKGIPCLVSMKASYHKKCYEQFSKIPSMVPKISQHRAQVEALFNQVANYIEESGSFQYSLSELQEIIGRDELSKEVLLKKLEERYGDDIHIERHRGKEPKIFYKILDIGKNCKDWFCNQGSLSDLQKTTVLKVAAEILQDDIKKFTYDNASYPAAHRFLDNVVSDIPPTLTGFLQDLEGKGGNENVEKNSVKRNHIAHSIVSLLRPKSFVSNLQLAVGTYISRKTGSKLIINLLSKLGACASYRSIQLHEASIIMDPPKMHRDPKTFVQFVFDNTDHNVSTLDGHETFHCLGGIAVYTPHDAVSYIGTSKKCTNMPSASQLASQKQIERAPHRTFDMNGMEDIEFVTTKSLELGELPSLPLEYAIYLWAKSLGIRDVPSWKGFMEVSSEYRSFVASEINCLPFINEAPSKLSTLHTALHYSASEGRKMNLETVFVTFDQPLYWKARSIVAQSGEELRNIVVRLGGFHLLMSYLGAIGYIMNGSGLEDLWSVVYAPESVKKMLTGHAFSRALRAHILTFTTLGVMICKSIDTTEEFNDFINKELGYWRSRIPLLDDFEDERLIREKTAKFAEKLKLLENKGPTAKLWVQYFQLVLIALQFVQAERIGDWTLHLQCVEKMLPIFHAAGHFSYAKSAQIYLQDMVSLETTMDPQEYTQFTTSGFFTVHRTDKAWSGVWTDMVIEQTLNRFFGTDLKHGRGVTPGVVARYLLAMPTAYRIMECLEDFCDIRTSTSEQHVDLSRSRIQHDEKDMEKMMFWLNKHAPFAARSSLTSLSTGMIGDSAINCHMAVEKGLQGMASMIGKNAKNISLSALYRVKNSASAQNKIHLADKNAVTVDTYLLFQRISVLFQGNTELTRNALTYELSPIPLSLFDENGFMRKTAKSELYKLFTPFVQCSQLKSSYTFVIDGGWLLHQIGWAHTSTYREVFETYLSYVVTNYGENSTVVFDGYQNELIGTKSYERYRRKEKLVAADIDIAEDHIITLQKTKFLSNIANKFKFVDLLSKFLQKHNINTFVANEDADTLIVRTAIELKEKMNIPVAVVGDDVDLFVLLIALTPEEERMYFLKISGKKSRILYSTKEHNHLKQFILFAHAFTGCDTTNAIYKKGKKTIVSLLQKNPELQKLISIFYEPKKGCDELYAAAEKLIINLYKMGNEKAFTINELRYKIFTSSVPLAKKELSLSLLPPTKSALYEHIKRVYHQIQLWLGNALDPLHWGWRRGGSMLLPIMFEGSPAPQELLDNVYCGCTTRCNSKRCRCKVAGLPCGLPCKNCHGRNCENASSEVPKPDESFDEELVAEDDLKEDEEEQEEETFLTYILEDDEEYIEEDFRYY